MNPHIGLTDDGHIKIDFRATLAPSQARDLASRLVMAAHLAEGTHRFRWCGR